MKLITTLIIVVGFNAYHSRAEVMITEPGCYRVSGTLKDIANNYAKVEIFSHSRSAQTLKISGEKLDGLGLKLGSLVEFNTIVLKPIPRQEIRFEVANGLAKPHKITSQMLSKRDPVFFASILDVKRNTCDLTKRH